MFPAARKGDPVTHDMVTPAGVIGPPLTGPCPMGVVMIEMLPAAHVLCTVACTGAVTGALVHPPLPVPPPIITGSLTVLIHNMAAARWAPSTDAGACGTFLGDLKLAATRTVLIGGPAGMPTGPGLATLKLAVATSLVDIVGSADAADGQLVARELTLLPMHALQILLRQGTRVKVCRNSVTDYRTDLRGVHPRGWDPGATWDNVPGLQSNNEVVIAVIGHGTPAGAHVPVSGEGHGSANMVVHEAAHALDTEGSGAHRSDSTAFTNARNADLATLTPYQQQPGEAGREESYAESAARYYGNDPNDAANHPNLNAYWAGDPLNPGP
jgi:hypothetical protein